MAENALRKVIAIGWRSWSANCGGLVLAAFTITAIGFGGGGSSAPFGEMVLQLIAALTLVLWIWIDPSDGRWQDRMSRRAVHVLLAAMLVLPVLQLVPLPPKVWQLLPGREVQADALALVGGDGRWMPWTMTPARTLASLLALLPAALVLWMAAQSSAFGRKLVLLAIAAMTGASVVLGALQLAAGASGSWRLYAEGNLGYLNGFQANRNAQADILLIGLIAAAALIYGQRDRFGRMRAMWVMASTGTVFVLACVLTGSRTGIALIPVALAVCLVIWRIDLRNLRILATGGAMLIAGAAVSWFVLDHSHALRRIAARFTLARDARAELWEDTMSAIITHWPMGSGVGSFRPVIVAAERLDAVDATLPVRAHNDYLEVLVEGGLPALLLLAVALVTVVLLALKARQTLDDVSRPHFLFAIGALVIIGLHSVVDYPLRSMALAHFAAISAGFLAALAARRPGATVIGESTE